MELYRKNKNLTYKDEILLEYEKSCRTSSYQLKVFKQIQNGTDIFRHCTNTRESSARDSVGLTSSDRRRSHPYLRQQVMGWCRRGILMLEIFSPIASGPRQHLLSIQN
eukprot:409959-Hanusia_phi.AAC.3